jgi:stearoyl-CoA desaturase (delta-9 desaturase)
VRGPIWWATHHRRHHRFVDQPGDPHSPVQKGFWYAHLGWLYDHLETDLDEAPDLTRYPELVWVNKYHSLFPYIPLVGLFALGQWTSFFGRTGLGLSAALWVFVLPTMIFLHATCCVNSVAHTTSEKKSGWFSRRRFNGSDATTNLWWLAIPTMGASWHNNHHRYMNSARAGFYRWEIDLSYVVLRILAAVGIVWDLHPVPAKVMDEGRGLVPHPSAGATPPA